MNNINKKTLVLNKYYLTNFYNFRKKNLLIPNKIENNILNKGSLFSLNKICLHAIL